MDQEMPRNKNQDGPWYDFEDFASMVGFTQGLDSLDRNREIKWTNTATDMRTGGIHGLRYKVEYDEQQELQVALQHWVHWPGGAVPPSAQKKRNPNLLTFKTQKRKGADGRTEIKPVAAEWMGKTYTDPAQIVKFMHLLQGAASEIYENISYNTARQPHDPGVFSEFQKRVRQIKRRDEIPNLYHLATSCDITVPVALEGMYFNGEFNFSSVKNSKDVPVYPLQLLRAMLGIESDILQKEGGAFSRSYTLPDSQGGGYEGVSYHYAPSEARDSFELSCRIWDTNQQGQKNEAVLYKIGFKRDGDAGNMYRLTHLEMLGHAPELTDHKGVARTIRAMKYGHLAIQRGEAPMFSDIIYDHDLKAFLARPEPPQEGPENARTSIQVFGANEDAAFSEKEKSIGSNGMVMVRDFMKDDKWVRQGIGVDWGVTFGDSENEFYHTISQNYGRFVRHPASPHIEPYVDTFINFETHEHEDHLRGVARLAKFGFRLPPLVMNAHTKRVLRRMMSEEGMRKTDVDGIMERCHVIAIDRYQKPEQDKEIFQYGDTIIEQGYETIYSEEEKREKYFPVLDVYNQKHPEAKTHVRVGPAGHSAHALMFEIAGVLYTGDYKLDQTIPAPLRTDLDWLAKCKDTAAVHVQESTNAPKAQPANAPIGEVLENRKKILAAEQKNRVFYDTIGSNAIDIETICMAAGQVRKEALESGAAPDDAPYPVVIFAGSAIRNKFTDMNITDNFKANMKAAFGIKALHIDSKEAQKTLAEGGRCLVVMTGTQDEELSVSHRVSRDLHEQIQLKEGDVMIRGQAPIPGDNRYAIREAQNSRYRHDFGCKVYDAYEMAQKGVHIYTSSHASQDDYRAVHDITGNLLKILHHGGPEQLHAMKKIMDDAGARAMIPNKQALYKVDHQQKDVEIIGETPEERLAFREIRGDQAEFFKRSRQQATTIPMKDHWQGAVAQRLAQFEAAVGKRQEGKLSSAPTSRGANMAAQFNDVAGNVDFPLIGVMHPDMKAPYYAEHKNIKYFIGMDTETTGVNPIVDVHTDISFTAADEDGKIVKGKTLKHALPRYLMPSPGALIVTQNDDPDGLYRKGLKTRKYVQEMFKTYREWPQELAGDKDARAVFFGYRNGVFDDPMTMRMMGAALAAKDMKPMSTYGNLQLDVYNLYSAMIAFMPDQTGAVKDSQGNYQRTLRTACLENDIEYNDDLAHGSYYDAERVTKLLFKFKNTAPDVFEQMVMNCDFSASRSSPMIDHILGQNLHINDHAPVFGYVDMRDRTCTPKLGALVTIDTEASKATDAIVLNLATADVHQLEQLPDDRLLDLMNDEQGPFAVIKLNNSPCLMPPQFVFRDPKVRARAVGNMPKTTLQARADSLKQMRARNSAEVGNSFIQRVQRLYQQSKLCRHPDKQAGADMPMAANGNRSSKDFRMPAERVFSLFHVIKAVNQIKSRHYKKAAGILKDAQPADEQFKKGFEREAYWKDLHQRACALSFETQGQDPYIEDLRFLIEWQIDDINPRWLPHNDKQRMNVLKSAMLHGPENAQANSVAKFVADLEEIENNPESFAKLIGTGPQAQEKWQALKETYLSFAAKMDRNNRYAFTDKKRNALREYRRSAPPVPPRRLFGTKPKPW